MKLQKGFTLIEVLIATVILAGGLLGLAALQTTGLKNNLSAYQRSQATQLAYDMADRMRANVIDAENAAGMYATKATDSDKTIVNTAQADCKATTGCTAANMAINDIYEWNDKVNDILLSGVGTITFADPVYTITISWDDDRDANTAAQSLPMSFTL
jgi:type IV pilus assembly protein PilV